MAISYPLSLPSSPGFSNFTLRRNTVSGMTRSPYNGVQYVITYPGQWWEFTAQLPLMDRADAMEWRAFFASLNGSAGTFLAGDPTAATPRGSAASTPGTPQVDGGSQTGAELDIKTGLGAVTGYLLAGDYIQLGSGSSSQLHMLMTDLDLDGTGKGTADIWPNLRSSPSDSATITVANCKGLFRRPSGITEDDAQPFPFFSMTLQGIEALS